jgi:hypothetical protein
MATMRARRRRIVAAAISACAAMLPVSGDFNPVAAQVVRACPPVKGGVNLFVETDGGRVVYDHTLNKQRLRALALKIGSIAAGSRQQPLGLTTVSRIWDPDLRLQGANIGRNRFCARIDTLKIKIVFNDLRVYVARDYPRGSCQYAAIIAHEHEHVDIFRTVLNKYRAIIERRSLAFVSNMKPGLGLTQEEAYQKVIRQIDHLWDELEQDMSREMAAKNATIDSPESYKQLSRQCRNW